MSTVSPIQLCVAFETERELRDAYAQDLAHGALFVPTREPAEPGTPVECKLELAFVGTCLTIPGEIVGVVPAAMAWTGAIPGASVLLAERGAPLRKRLEEASGVDLRPVDPAKPSFRRAVARFPARGGAIVDYRGRAFPAETVDLSHNGMLVLLNGIELEEDSPVRMRLTHPRSGTSIDVEGRVAHQARCDHGIMAVGIQFQYALERVDEVTGFIDDLCGFRRAEKLAAISGSLEESGLDAVLETFAGISRAGTLTIQGGYQDGQIAYEDGQILYALTGLVSGTKALGRMFSWADARFEFRPEVERFEAAQEPLPLASAVITAAIERDEIAQLDLRGIDLTSTFGTNAALLEQLRGDLNQIQNELVDQAAVGFPLGVILDVLPSSDAAIFRALADLVESGILASQPPAAP